MLTATDSRLVKGALGADLDSLLSKARGKEEKLVLKELSKDTCAAALMCRLRGKHEKFLEFLKSEFVDFKDFKTFATDIFPLIPDDVRFKELDVKRCFRAAQTFTEAELKEGIKHLHVRTELVTHLNMHEVLSRTPALTFKGGFDEQAQELHMVISTTGETVPLKMTDVISFYESGKIAIEKVAGLLPKMQFVFHEPSIPLGQLAMSLVHFFTVRVEYPSIKYLPKANIHDVPKTRPEYATVVNTYLVELANLADVLNNSPYDCPTAPTNEIIPLVYHHLTLCLSAIPKELERILGLANLVRERYMEIDSDADIDRKLKNEAEKLQKQIVDDFPFDYQKKFTSICATFRAGDKKNESYTSDATMDIFMPHQAKRRWGGISKLDAFLEFRDGLRKYNKDFEFKQISVVGEAADVVVRIIREFYVQEKIKIPELFVSMPKVVLKYEDIKFREWKPGHNVVQALCRDMEDEPTSLMIVCNYQPDSLGFDKRLADVTSVNLLLESITSKNTSLILPHTACGYGIFNKVLTLLKKKSYQFTLLQHPREDNDTYNYLCSKKQFTETVNVTKVALLRTKHMLEIVRRNALRNHYMTFGYDFPKKPTIRGNLLRATSLAMMIRYDDIKVKDIQNLAAAREMVSDLYGNEKPEVPESSSSVFFTMPTRIGEDVTMHDEGLAVALELSLQQPPGMEMEPPPIPPPTISDNNSDTRGEKRKNIP